MSKKYKPVDRFKEYKDRNLLLKAMGFNSYQNYLISNEWKEIRNLYYRDHKKCEFCDATEKLNIHHKTYTKLMTRQPEGLIVLCKECHILTHAIKSAFPELSLDLATNKAKIIKKFINNPSRNK